MSHRIIGSSVNNAHIYKPLCGEYFQLLIVNLFKNGSVTFKSVLSPKTIFMVKNLTNNCAKFICPYIWLRRTGCNCDAQIYNDRVNICDIHVFEGTTSAAF